MIKQLIYFALLTCSPLFALAQKTSPPPCDIKQRIEANGSMLYYIEPVRFYWTTNKSLYGAIVTDKENYFLTLLPRPFPAKDDNKDMAKDDLRVSLANDSTFQLSYYDSYYINDTTFVMMYLIDKDHISEFREKQVEKILVHVDKKEGIRNYQLKLHKGAFRDQLNCFFDRKD